MYIMHEVLFFSILIQCFGEMVKKKTRKEKGLNVIKKMRIKISDRNNRLHSVWLTGLMTQMQAVVEHSTIG